MNLSSVSRDSSPAVSYVLVVDDNRVMAEAIAGMVQLMDWEARVAPGPRAALQAVHDAPPALILMDLNMQGVNGLEVMRYIRRDPTLEKVPVVFVTAEDDPSIQNKVMQAGALDYLLKPIDFDKLEKVLLGLSKT